VPRDEESTQPETPLLGRSVQLPGEDTLAGDPGSDPLDSGYVPPDRPFALEERATTAAGQREGDSLDERLAREEPDVADEHEEDVADPRAGRLVADDEGVHSDTEADLVGHDIGIDGGAASAEEAAVHELEEDELP
jgi:hypothetical protein